MTRADWRSNEEIFRLFVAVGRASLLADMQDSHSGNMSMKYTDSEGREHIAITATGSQKGDLEPSQICYIPATETDYGYYKASSETDTHARILNLPGVRATIHVHAKDLTIATLDDRPKPSSPPGLCSRGLSRLLPPGRDPRRLGLGAERLQGVDR